METWQESDLKAREAIAWAQLTRWQDRARYWPVYHDGAIARCVRCRQAVWQIRDSHGGFYRYDDDTRRALTVAHLRQAHEGEFGE